MKGHTILKRILSQLQCVHLKDYMFAFFYYSTFFLRWFLHTHTCSCILNMFHKPFWGFLVILVVVPDGSANHSEGFWLFLWLYLMEVQTILRVCGYSCGCTWWKCEPFWGFLVILVVVPDGSANHSEGLWLFLWLYLMEVQTILRVSGYSCGCTWWKCKPFWGFLVILVVVPDGSANHSEGLWLFLWLYLMEVQTILRVSGYSCGCTWWKCKPFWGFVVILVVVPDGSANHSEGFWLFLWLYLTEVQTILRVPGYSCGCTWWKCKPFWGFVVILVVVPDGSANHSEGFWLFLWLYLMEVQTILRVSGYSCGCTWWKCKPFWGFVVILVVVPDGSANHSEGFWLFLWLYLMEVQTILRVSGYSCGCTWWKCKPFWGFVVILVVVPDGSANHSEGLWLFLWLYLMEVQTILRVSGYSCGCTWWKCKPFWGFVVILVVVPDGSANHSEGLWLFLWLYLMEVQTILRVCGYSCGYTWWKCKPFWGFLVILVVIPDGSANHSVGLWLFLWLYLMEVQTILRVCGYSCGCTWWKCKPFCGFVVILVVVPDGSASVRIVNFW